MGFPTEDSKVGSLVWVQRKNGTWWPGKIISGGEISASFHLSSPSSSKTPIKLLGRENGSVEWFNLGTSKRIKSFRCGDFDDFIRRAESCLAYPCIKDAKYAHRENAILHALQLEKQEQRNRLKRPAGEVHQRTVCRAKRSRCVYFEVESHQHVELSTLQPQSLKVSPSASAKVLAAEYSTSGPLKSDYSDNDFKSSDGDGVTQPKGDATVQLPKQKSKENCSVVPRNKTRKITDLLMEDSACQKNTKHGFDAKSGEDLALEVNIISHPTWADYYLEDSDNIHLGSQCINHQNRVENMLMDVDIEVLANYRKEHVPLVSLMSRLHNKAIIGHPIEIEALHDTSEIFLVRKNHFHHMFNKDERRKNQLIWRTSRRSPVCYISNCHSSPTKEDKGEEGCKNSDGSSLEPRSDDLLQKKKTIGKPQKKAIFQQNGSRSPPNAKGQNVDSYWHNLQITSPCSRQDGLHRQGSYEKQGVTCVPVNFIFTNLLSAMGTSMKANFDVV